MLLRSTLVSLLRSAIDLIASKAIGANSVAFWETILDESEVLTH